MSSDNHHVCLLVEDVAAMRALLRAILEDTGCEIIEAGNLQEARRVLRAHEKTSIGYAVLDIDLPDGNGLELIPELGDEVRVIALTAYETRETHLRCLNMGCDAVLSKGGQLAELRKMLLRHGVSRRAARREVPDHQRKLYFRYLEETRLELEDARRKSDFLTVRRIAHRLRGTAIHFGHPGIGQFAKSVTVALAAGRFSQVEAQTGALSAGIAEVLESHQFERSNHLGGKLVSTGSTG